MYRRSARRRNNRDVRHTMPVRERTRTKFPGYPLKPLARYFRHAAIPAGLLLTTTSIIAGPTGEQVVAGSANVSRPDTTTTVIQQHTTDVAIDWSNFNINQNELVQFNQPSTGASALNRIFDQNPTQIFGSLRANGNVLLVNPNGVFFSPTAHVNVNSLIASGLDIAPQDFMAGNYNFQTPVNAEGGMVVNQGILEAATGGSISLVGGAVSNEGLIYAHTGQVNLVAGKRVTMDFDGDGLIQFSIDESILENTHGVDSAVSNSGEINAEGGAVLLKGSTARDVFSNVVNNDGVIRAARIENVGGVIRLVADGDSNSLLNTGTLDASGQGGDGGTIQLQATGNSLVSGESVITAASDTGKGGEILVLGDNVGLLDLSSLDVSGPMGGGEVLIGGDYQGNNPEIANATRTYLSDDVSINADALDTGDGGKVIVWSDEFTKVDATITARGGQQGGDGGLVETSSKGHLEVFTAEVDAGAKDGEAGEWLLDPTNVTIENLAGASTGGSFDSGNPDTWTPSASPSQVDTDAILTSLANGTSVTITTNDDAGTDGGEAGNITLLTGAGNDISASLGITDVTLTLHADNDIILNNTITQSGTLGGWLSVDLLAANDIVVNSAITLIGGDLSLTADAANLDANVSNGADGIGNIDINATLDTGGGAFISSGIDFDNSGGVIGTLGGDLTINHSGTVTLGAALNYGVGTLSGIATDVLVLSTGGSVQDGIDIIDTTNGGKVTVGDGAFTEDLSISTDNLFLTSLNGKANSAITGVTSDAQANFALQNATNISIDANNVTIDDLTLTTPNVPAGNYSTLIGLIGENISITNNDLISAQGNIAPTGANDGLTNSMIRSIAPGIAPAGSIDGLTITGNSFDGNGKGYYGVYLNQQGAAVGTLAGDEVLIDSNTFNGNIWRAISTERSNADITNNILSPGTDTLALWAGSGIAVRNLDGTAIDDIRIDSNVFNTGDLLEGDFANEILLGYTNTDPLTNISISNETGSIVVTGDVSNTGALAWDTTANLRVNSGGSLTATTDVDLLADGIISLSDAAISAPSGNIFLEGSDIIDNEAAAANIIASGLLSLTASTAAIGGIVSLEVAGVSDLVLDSSGSFEVTSTDGTSLDSLSITVDASAGTSAYTLSGFGSGLAIVNDTNLSDLGNVLTISGISSTSAMDVSITNRNGNIDLDDNIPGTAAVDLSAAGGNITITAESGNIVDRVAQVGDAPSTDFNLITQAAGIVTLNAPGNAVGGAGDADIDVSGSANIAVNAEVSFISTNTTLSSLELKLDPAADDVNIQLSGATTVDIDELCAAGSVCIDDVDNGGNDLNFTLTTANGDISIDSNASGTAGIYGIGDGNVTLTAEAGTILDRNADANINIALGGILTLSASGGIGTTGNFLDVSDAGSLNGIDLDLSRTAASNIALNITGDTTVNSFNSGVFTGSTDLITGSALTINTNISQAGDITLTANEDAAQIAGDNLTVNAGITVQSTGGNITLRAGDNIVLNDGASITTAPGTGFIELSAGWQDNDLAALGGPATAATIDIGDNVTVTTANTSANALRLRAADVAIDTTGGTSISATGLGGGIQLYTLDGDGINTIDGAQSMVIGDTSGGTYILDDNELPLITDFDTLTIGESGVQSGAISLVTVTSPVADAAIIVNSNSGSGQIILDDQSILGDEALTSGGSGNITLNAGSNGITAASTTGTLAPQDVEISTSGSITLNSAGVIGSASNRIQFESGQDQVSIGNAPGGVFLDGLGDLTLSGITSGGGAVDISAAGSLSVIDGTSILTGDSTLTILAADIDLNTTGTLNSGTAAITIEEADGNGIEIGDSPGGGGMTVSALDLSNITADSLLLTSAGAVTATSLSTAGNTSNIAALEFESTGSDITIDGSAVRVDSALTLDANQDVNIDSQLEVGSSFVDGVAGDSLTVAAGDDIVWAVVTGTTTLADGNISFTAGNSNAADGADGIDITTSAAGSLIQSTDGAIDFNSNVAVTNGGAPLRVWSDNGIDIDGSFVGDGAVDLEFDANIDNAAGGTFTVGPSGSIDSTGATIDIDANDLILDGTLSSGAGLLTITNYDGSGIDLGTATASAGMDIDQTELINITTSGGLTIISTGTIASAGITNTNTANITGTVTLTGNSVVLGDGDDWIGALIADSSSTTTVNGALTAASITLDSTTDTNIADGAVLTADTGSITLGGDAGITSVGSTSLSAISTVTIEDAYDHTSGSLSITTNDFELTAALDATAQTVTVTEASGTGIDISDAPAGAGMNISATELSNITADSLLLSSAGAVTATSLSTAGNTSNIAALEFESTTDDVSINGTAVRVDSALTLDANQDVNIDSQLEVGSSFLDGVAGDSLTVTAGDDIVWAVVTGTTTLVDGNISFTAGNSNAADGADGIDITTSAAGSLVQSTDGAIDFNSNVAVTNGGAPLRVWADSGIDIDGSFVGDGAVALEFDADVDNAAGGTFTVGLLGSIDSAGATVDIDADGVVLNGTVDSGDFTITNTGLADINAKITAAGAVLFDSVGAINLSADIETVSAAGAITVNDSVLTVENNVRLLTNDGNITLDEILDDGSSRDLELVAGTGNIIIDDNVGVAGTTLGLLDIESANDVHFSGLDATLDVDQLTIGSVTAITNDVEFDAAVNVGGNVDINSDTLTLDAVLNTSNAGTVTVSNTGLADLNAKITSAGNVLFDSTGAINLGAGIETTDASAAITIDDSVLTVEVNAQLLTNDGNITLDEVLDDGNSRDLELVAGTGNILIDDNVGVNAGDTLGLLNIASAGDVHFSSLDATVDVGQLTIGGTTPIVNDVEFDGTVNVAGNVDIDTNTLTLDAALNTTNGGSVTVSNTDLADINAKVTAAGTVLFDSSGPINLGADIETTDNAAAITVSNSAITLNNDVQLITNNGNIRLDEVLDDTNSRNLALVAGTGNIIIDDNVGVAGTTLGLLDIQSADDVHFSTSAATVDVGQLTIGSTTPIVIDVEFDGVVNVAGNVDIDTNTLTLDADLNTASAGTVTVSNTGLAAINANINSAGTVLFDSTGNINLDGDISTTDSAAAISIPDSRLTLMTNARLITNDGNITLDEILDDNNSRSLELAAGSGNVLIDDNVGVNGGATPGLLSIESAGDVHFSTIDATVDVDQLSIGSVSAITNDVEFDSAVNVGGNVDIDTNTLTLDAALNTGSGGTVTVSNTGVADLNAKVTSSGTVLFDSTGGINLGADIETTAASAAITVNNSALTLNSDARLITNNGNITLDEVLDDGGTWALELAAGTANVLVDDNIGTSVNQLGLFDIESAGGVQFSTSAATVDVDQLTIGSVTAIDNAVDIDGTVTTTGAIDISAATINVDAELTTTGGVGGTVDLSGASTLSAGITTDGGAVTLDTGAVTVDSNVTIDTTNVDNTPAGGDITLETALNADTGATRSLTLDAGSDGIIDLNADVGTTTSLLSFTVEDAGAVNLLAVTVNGGDITVGNTDPANLIIVDGVLTTLGAGPGGQLSINGGGIVLNVTPVLGDTDIILNGDGVDIVIGTTLIDDSTITLTAPRDILVQELIQTTAAGADIILRADSDDDNAGGVLVAASGQVDAFRDATLTGSSWTNLGGAGAFNSDVGDAVHIKDDAANVQVQAGRNITLEYNPSATSLLSTEDIIVSGRLSSTGAGAVLIDAEDVIELSSTITTQGGTVDFADGVLLTGTASVDSTNAGADTNGAGITFQDTLDGFQTLTLNAGDLGNIDFDGAVGGLDRVGDLSITNAADVTVDFGLTASTITQVDGQGITTFTGAVDTNAAGGIDLNGNDFNLDNTVTTTNGGTVTISNTGLADINAKITSAGTVLFDSTGDINLGADIEATDVSAAITVNDSVMTVDANARLITNDGNITLDEILDDTNSRSLELVAGSGNIIIDDNVAVAGTSLGLLDIESAGSVDFSGAAATLDVDQLSIGSVTAVTNNVKFDGDVNVAGNIDINTNTLTVDAVLNTSNTGTLTVSNTGLADINQDITSAGTVLFDSTGGISLQADIETTDVGAAISVDDSILTLNSNVRLVTDDGNITLDEVRDDGGSWNLELVAGTGNIAIDDNVGLNGGATLGLVDVESAGDVLFSSAAATVDVDQLTIGSVTSVVNGVEFGGVVNVGGNVDIDTNTLTLDAALNTDGGGTVTVSNNGTADLNAKITASGAVLFDSTGDINLAADIETTGVTPAITVNNSALTLKTDVRLITNNGNITLDEIRDDGGSWSLELVAGTGNVLVDDNIGSGASPLGLFDIESAGDVLFSGVDATLDVDQLTIGSVSAIGNDVEFDAAVTTTGAIDVSSASINVDAQLTTTGGVGGTVDLSGVTTLSAGIVTDGGAVTLDTGAVTVDSNVTIDTTNSNNTPAGADITLDTALNADLGATRSLTLDAGSDGIIDINANVGTTSSLLSFTVEDAGAVNLLAVTVDGGDITVGNTDPVNLITVDGVLTTLGDGPGGQLSLNGGGIVLNATPVLGDTNITLNGDGDDIVIGASLSDDSTITLTAPRDILVQDVIQTTSAGADIILSADSDNDADGGVLVAAAGQVDAFRDATLTGSSWTNLGGTGSFDADVGDAIHIKADDAAGVQVQAGGNITLQYNPSVLLPLGTEDIVVAGRLSSSGAGAVLIDAEDVIELSSTVTTEGGTVDFADAVLLTATASVDSTAGGADVSGASISFQGTLDGANNLTVNAGSTGDIDFDGAVGGADRVGNLSITNANNVTVDFDLSASSITQLDGQGTTTFTGAVDTNAAGGIDLTGNAFTFSGGINTSSGGGLSINNDGLLTIASSATVTLDGALLQNSSANTGSTSLGDDITTAGDSITFAEAVTLTQSVALDTTSAGANANGAAISFGATLDATTSGTESITMDAGATGNILMSGDVGATTPLGGFIISDANNVNLQAVTTDAATIRIGVSSTTRARGILTLNGDLTSHAGAAAGTISLFADAIRLQAPGAGTITLDSNGTADANITIITDTISPTGALVSTTLWEDGLSLDAGDNLVDLSDAKLDGLDHLIVNGSSLNLGDTVLGDGGANANVALDVTTSGAFNLFGDISTAGDSSNNAGAIDLTGVAGDIILSSGGIFEPEIVTLTTDADGTDASIQLGDVEDGGTDLNLFVNAGTEDVTLASVGTGDAIGTLVVDGNDITFNGDVEATGIIARAVQGADDDSIVVDAIDDGTSLTLDANGGSINFRSDDIFIRTDAGDVALLTSTGGGTRVRLRGESNTTEIAIGDNASALSALDLDLSEAELQTIDASFTNLVIGGTDQSGKITVDESGDGLTGLNTNLSLNAPNGDIVIDSVIDMTATPGAGISLTGDGSTTFLSAGLITDGGDIVIDDSVLVDGAITIDSGDGGASASAGLIRIFHDIGAEGTATDSLTLLAVGTADGNITIDGIVGGGIVNDADGLPLDSFTATGAIVTLDDVHTDGGVIDITGSLINLEGSAYDTINSGAISFDGPVRLNSSGIITIEAAGGSNISFSSNINDDTPDDSDLVLNTAGTTDLNGVIGGTNELASLTTNEGGTTELNANVNAGSGGMDFNDAVVLTDNITLSTNSGQGIDFASTVSGDFNLGLADAGAGTVFNGAVNLGSGTGAAISIGSAGTTEFISTVDVASGIVQAGDAGEVTFRDDVTIAAGNTNSIFNADVVLDGLTLDAQGIVVLGDTADDSLTISSDLVVIDTTTNDSTIALNATTTLESDLTLSAGSGLLLLDGDVNGNNDLVLNSTGTTIIDGDIGPVTPVASVTTNAGGTTQLADDISVSSGGMDFNDAVLLLADITLSTASGTGIDFASTVDGNFNLVLDDAVGTVFNGAVGNSLLIGTGTGAALTINSTGTTEFIGTLDVNSGIVQANNAGEVTFRDDVFIAAGDTDSTFNADVVLDGLTLDAQGAVTLGSSEGDDLTISSGLVVLDTVTNDEMITINAATTLNSDLTLTAGGGDILINGNVDGNNNLVLNSTGTTDIDDDIGTDTPIASLTTDAGGNTILDDDINVTTGGIAFNDPVEITIDVTLTTASGVGIDFFSTLDGNHNLVLNDAVGTVFHDAVGSGTPLGTGSGAALTINSTGTTEFQSTLDVASGIEQNGDAGTVTFRQDVSIGAGDTDSDFNADIVLDGLTISSDGDLNFGDETTDQVTLSTSEVTIDTSASNTDQDFTALVDGNVDFTLDAGNNGDIGFATALGSNTRLGVLTFSNADNISADAAVSANEIVQLDGQGTTTFNGLVDTNTINGIDLTGNNFTFTGGVNTTSGGGVTVDNDGLLTIANDSPFILDGAFLQDSTANTGSTSLDDNITTTGDTITFEEDVVLSQTVSLDTTLGGNGGGATVTFGGTLDATTAGIQGISIDAGTGGDIDFNDDIGSGTRLGALILSNANNVNVGQSLTAASINQLTGQGSTVFSGTVDTNTLEGIDLNSTNFSFADTVTTSAGGTVTITHSGLLDIADAADMDLDGAFTVDGNGDITTEGNITTTADDILFDGSGTVTIGVNDVDLVSNGGDIRFDGNVTGAGLLSLDADTGNISFTGTVGAGVALSGLLVTGADTLDFASTLDLDDEGLDLNATTINLVDTVTTTNGGTVTLSNTGLLDLPATAIMDLDGAFLQDGTGLVQTAADITTTGDDITFQSGVTLTDGGVISFTSANGTITFNSTIDAETAGVEDLTLNAGAGGDINFDAAVGGTGELGLLTITDVNNFTADSNISATGITQVDGQGTSTFNGTLATSTVAGVDLDGNNFTFNNIVTTDASGGITLTHNGLVDINAKFTASGNVLFDGPSTADIDLGADIETTGTGSFIRVDDALIVLNSDVTLTTNDGDITLDEVQTDTDETHTLTLAAGLGDIVVDDNIGVDGTGELAGLRISSASNVDFSTADSEIHAGQVDIGSPFFSDPAIENNVHFSALVKTDTGPITVEADSIVVDGVLDTTDTAGAGGQLFLGSVTLNASPNVGAFNISLNGKDQDTVITAPIIENVPVSISAFRDVIIQSDVSTTVGNVLIIADVDNQDFGAGAGGVLIDDIGSVAASNGDITITGTAFTNLGGTGSFGEFVDDAIIVLADGGGADQINAAGNISLIADGDPLVGTGNIIINGDITSTAGDISSISVGSTLLGGAATLDAANTLSIRIDSFNNSSRLLDLGDAVLTGTTIALSGGDDGNDTLFGQDIDSSWTITGDDAGTLSNGNINTVANYADFQNLTGGTAADSFNYISGNISGVVDGNLGDNTLDYSGGPAATITVTGPGSLDGFQGTATGITTFDNIDALVGSGTTDTLVGDIEAGGTFTVDAGGNTYSSGPNSLSFSAIEDLVGGAGTDTFNINFDHSGNIDPGAGDDILNLTGGSTITGTVTDTAGNNTFDLSGNVTNGVSSGAGNDSYIITGNSQTDITVTGGNNNIVVNAPLTGSLFLAGDSSNDNTIEINADISGGINGGDANETIIFNNGDLTSPVSAGGGRNIYNFTNGTASGQFTITGDDVWNHVSGVPLGSTVVGNGALAVAGQPQVDLSISPDDLNLPDLTGFEGHLIIGGTIVPGFPPLDGDETITVNTDNLTVSPSSIQTAGDITLLASNIFIEADALISAGGPGGDGTPTDQVTLIAVGDNNGGSGPGDITGVSFPGTIQGASALIIAANDIINPENLSVELDGGDITPLVGSGITPAFGFLGGVAVAPTDATFAFLDALAAGTGLNVSLLTFVQAQTLILTSLIGLEQISFIDVGLFEEDLTLFGQVGQGIALSLAQCEEIEGCAPNITEAELNELIEQLEGRITELERRLEDADISNRAQLERLLAGYRTEYANFTNYRTELQVFYAQEEEFDDAFADEFGEDLATVEIQRLNDILEIVEARIEWLESLKSDAVARTRLGEQTGIELTIEAIDSIILATRQQVRFIERQIQQLLNGSQALKDQLFHAESGDLAMARFPVYKNNLYSYDAYIFQQKDVWY